MDKLLKEQIERFEAWQKSRRKELCTCKDRGVYIAGKYFIIKATTDYKNCIICTTNPGMHQPIIIDTPENENE